MPEEKTVSEHILKITGSACIEKELQHGQDYKLAIECSCYSVEEKDNHDGTLNRVYKLRMLGEVYVNDAGKSLIKGKSKAEQSPSQRLWKTLWVLWSQKYTGSSEDYEKWYKEKIEEIINQVKKQIV